MTSTLPPENVQRGTIFTLLVIPAGIIVWLLIWSIGWIASIVAFGVAIGALRLYRWGSGGRVGRVGATTVTVVTIVTLLLSFVSGMVMDIGRVFTRQQGVGWVEALTSGDFWRVFSSSVNAGFGSVAGSFALALLFGVLGCFSVLRAVFAQAQAESALPLATPPGFAAPGPIMTYPTTQPETLPEPESDAAR
jgi:hypothetical protein